MVDEDKQIKENEKLIIAIIYQFYKIRRIEAIEAIVRKMGMDFDDLKQIGRIAYMKAMRKYDGKGGFNGFFAVIFHNDLKVLARKQGAEMRQGEVFSIDYMLDGVGDETDLAISNLLVDENVDVESDVMASTMLDKLSPKDKWTFLMYANGHSQNSIGRITGHHQRTICKRLQRIRRELYEQYC